MRYKIILGIIVIAALSLIFAYIIIESKQQFQESQVCFNNNCFTMELAITPDERSKGLMFRERLDEDSGMLFVFEREGVYTFWMKNTLISLDIIWIDSNNKVVFINRNTQPCESIPCASINPGKQAKYVLEINAGISDKISLAVGDEITMNI